MLSVTFKRKVLSLILGSWVKDSPQGVSGEIAVRGLIAFCSTLTSMLYICIKEIKQQNHFNPRLNH